MPYDAVYRVDSYCKPGRKESLAQCELLAAVAVVFSEIIFTVLGGV